MGNMHLVTGYAGQPHVKATDNGSLNVSIFGDGQYVLNRGSKLSATTISGNCVRIADGDIMMKGRHIRLADGYVDLTIENGTQGMKRNDLIVARYSKESIEGVEDVNLVVIKGTAVDSNPVDPAFTDGDIISGNALVNDMPLYRVALDGVEIQEVVCIFSEYEGGGDYVSKEGDTMTGNLIITRREATTGHSAAVYLQGLEGSAPIQGEFYTASNGTNITLGRTKNGQRTNAMVLYDDRVEFDKPIVGVPSGSVLLWEGTWSSGSLKIAKTGGTAGCTGLGDLNEWFDIMIQPKETTSTTAIYVHLGRDQVNVGGGGGAADSAGKYWGTGFRAGVDYTTNTLTYGYYRWQDGSGTIPIVRIYGIRRWSDVMEE